MSRPHILTVAKLAPLFAEQLHAAYEVHDRLHETDPVAFAKVAPLIRGIAGSGESKVPRALMDQLPALEVVSIMGVGYDGVDVSVAVERSIPVTHTPGVLNDEVADLAIGLMLSIARRIPQADQYVRAGRWGKEGPMPLTRKVSGARLGIVGLGRIGQAIARRAEAFSMSIAYTGRKAQPGVAYAYYPTATALAEQVDFLIVITPGGAGTHHLINSDVLKALGPEGYLINVARGSVVDEDALVDALRKRAIAGAALDVFAREPHPSESLWGMDNVVLTPHIASATRQTRQAMAELAAANLHAHFAGQPLVSPVPEWQ
ncbi:2-hydroxyacid dehydrogenase [Rhodoferax sp.]|uniref:2-hydroxyacid dehydrogenase n=1 Tax=Rhodoferax sp. TaxID=50421 RepID=UPI002730F031|nr:2-hydroxyacid dehydrogenase [Rhodoferax sp.]MDP1943041.1 2-hydroxyacid dehydrogenase [Rhodoferax sp.]MDP3752889.1 2-hydroxyacid dehydrogenase [Polaromonas sp.]